MASSRNPGDRSSSCTDGSNSGSATATTRSSRQGSGREKQPTGSTATTSSATPASAASRGPSFTAEDEVREKDALTPIERIEAECDRRGIVCPREAASYAFPASDKGIASCDVEGDPTEGIRWEHDALIQEAIAKVNSRLRKHSADQMEVSGYDDDESSSKDLLHRVDEQLRSIPDEEKASYLQAVERQCPDALTSDPCGRSRRIAMIRHCDNDTRLAAKRIVEYWEERRRTFGEDRCYLPMALHGTMKDHVTVMLKQTTHRILQYKDNAGRSILIFDVSSSGSNDNESTSAPESDKLEVRRRGAYPQSHALLQTSFDAPNHVSFSSYY